MFSVDDSDGAAFAQCNRLDDLFGTEARFTYLSCGDWSACGFGYPRLRHFFLDAGQRRLAGFFSTILMQHASIMTSRWKPCSPISDSCEICGRFPSVASRSDRQDQESNSSQMAVQIPAHRSAVRMRYILRVSPRDHVPKTQDVDSGAHKTEARRSRYPSRFSGVRKDASDTGESSRHQLQERAQKIQGDKKHDGRNPLIESLPRAVQYST
jgi:hypothetical protein